MSAPLAAQPLPRAENLQQDIIVLGPPICGVSTMCVSLSKKLGLSVKKVDEILDDVAMTNSELGACSTALFNGSFHRLHIQNILLTYDSTPVSRNPNPDVIAFTRA